MRKISRGQERMTIHDMELTGFGCAGSCRAHTSRRDEGSTPKGWTRGITKIGPVSEVKVTYHLFQYGIEIKNDSMKNDGSQSRIVTSKKMKK